MHRKHLDCFLPLVGYRICLIRVSTSQNWLKLSNKLKLVKRNITNLVLIRQRKTEFLCRWNCVQRTFFITCRSKRINSFHVFLFFSSTPQIGIICGPILSKRNITQGSLYNIHIVYHYLLVIQWCLSWRTTAMRDHQSWRTTKFCQKVPHFNANEPVTKGHLPWDTILLWPMGIVFQHSFCTLYFSDHCQQISYQFSIMATNLCFYYQCIHLSLSPNATFLMWPQFLWNRSGLIREGLLQGACSF